jgi:hypothetical protein
MNIKRNPLIAISFIIFFLLSRCSPSESDLGIKVKLQRELIIQEKDEIPPIFFNFIRHISTDLAGNIYVLDQEKVMKFDTAGKLLWENDRHGQGPGEFSRIVDLDVSRTGKIFVADQNKMKVFIFSGSGQYIDEFSTGGVSPLEIEVDSKENIYLAYIGSDDEFLLHKYDSSGELVDSFVRGNTTEKIPLLRNAKNSITFCVDRKDNIIISFIYEYKILKYSPECRLIGSWRRALPYKPRGIEVVSPQPNMMKIAGDRITQGIAADNQDSIYVLWGCKKTDNGVLIDMFSPAGILWDSFYSSVDTPYDMQNIYIDYQDRLYVVDPIEDPKIYRFKIVKVEE